MKSTDDIIKECGYDGSPPITRARMSTAMVVYAKELIAEMVKYRDPRIYTGPGLKEILEKLLK